MVTTVSFGILTNSRCISKRERDLPRFSSGLPSILRDFFNSRACLMRFPKRQSTRVRARILIFSSDVVLPNVSFSRIYSVSMSWSLAFVFISSDIVGFLDHFSFFAIKLLSSTPTAAANDR